MSTLAAPLAAEGYRRPPRWVLSRPPASTQTEKPVEARGGNPCKPPDPGFGDYRKWDPSPVLGEMMLPKAFRLRADGAFDVVFHFHHHERARIHWVQSLRSGVLVGVDLGVLSGPYVAKFNGTDAFEQLVHSVEQAVAERFHAPRAHAGRVALSSWSAGYGAIGAILRSDYGQRRVDGVILLDGLHTDRVDTPAGEASLAPFLDFARRAAHGETLMYVSHSSIIPRYASTTQTANYLIWRLGGKPRPVRHPPKGPYGLERISEYSAGNFHVYGYSGNGPTDHCAQLALYEDALRRWLAPRWGLATVKREPHPARLVRGTQPAATQHAAAQQAAAQQATAQQAAAQQTAEPADGSGEPELDTAQPEPAPQDETDASNERGGRASNDVPPPL